MNEHGRLTLPCVTDEDVTWVCQLLSLPPGAFGGPSSNDPRLDILKCNDTMDVEACPGSGKTTLLVAKLAILSRRWTDPRRGFCVLSHTNVARHEIERRLGSAREGRRLLSYPHFIGTIHSFVNEFLAIPWLRSKGLPIRMIDDDVALGRRWENLPRWAQEILQKKRDARRSLRVSTPDFSLGDVRWSRDATLRTDSRIYRAMASACKRVCEEGYFCYDEMFVWAKELLDQVPEVTGAVRERFPVLFIDEVQDNSQAQSELLYRLFMLGPDPVIRQRFGDADQAIYESFEQREGATTDTFPGAAICRDIPNSHRFGQDIARLAGSLAVGSRNLSGRGPRDGTIAANTVGKHAIFLFNKKTVGHVLPVYARYLLELFSDDDLRAGTFAAVGAVHRPEASEHRIPHSVRHYWRDYDPELASPAPRPGTFYQYLEVGRRLARESGEAHWIVEKIAEGILRAVLLVNPHADIGTRRRAHRHVLDLLRNNPELRTRYLELVSALALGESDPTADEWCTKWLSTVEDIAMAIGGPSSRRERGHRFLEWREPDGGDEETGTSRQRDNIFRYPPCAPKVQIRVGSIHSVKGQTHTATLVLDTYYKTYNLAALKAWLLGAQSGGGTEGSESLCRLRQHYVAMTRPSHLLCLAMREDAFLSSELDGLKSRGWRIARVTDGDVLWL